MPRARRAEQSAGEGYRVLKENGHVVYPPDVTPLDEEETSFVVPPVPHASTPLLAKKKTARRRKTHPGCPTARTCVGSRILRALR